jgi:hypothetical protein
MAIMIIINMQRNRITNLWSMYGNVWNNQIFENYFKCYFIHLLLSLYQTLQSYFSFKRQSIWLYFCICNSLVNLLICYDNWFIFPNNSIFQVIWNAELWKCNFVNIIVWYVWFKQIHSLVSVYDHSFHINTFSANWTDGLSSEPLINALRMEDVLAWKSSNELAVTNRINADCALLVHSQPFFICVPRKQFNLLIIQSVLIAVFVIANWLVRWV